MITRSLSAANDSQLSIIPPLTAADSTAGPGRRGRDWWSAGLTTTTWRAVNSLSWAGRSRGGSAAEPSRLTNNSMTANWKNVWNSTLYNKAFNRLHPNHNRCLPFQFGGDYAIVLSTGIVLHRMQNIPAWWPTLFFFFFSERHIYCILINFPRKLVPKGSTEMPWFRAGIGLCHYLTQWPRPRMDIQHTCTLQWRHTGRDGVSNH